MGWGPPSTPPAWGPPILLPTPLCPVPFESCGVRDLKQLRVAHAGEHSAHVLCAVRFRRPGGGCPVPLGKYQRHGA